MQSWPKTGRKKQPGFYLQVPEGAIHTPQVVTDSTCDLPKPLLDRWGITVVPMMIDIGGEVLREGLDITQRELYEWMARTGELPKTSQPSPSAFEAAFSVPAADGPLLCLTLSSKLSGTYQAACLARDLTGADVTVFDTLTTSLGLGLHVVRACELLGSGHSIGETVAELTRYRGEMKTLVLLNTLENIVKGGRLSRFQGTLSSALDIRVLLNDVEGEVVLLEKVHGHKKLLHRTVERMVARRPDLSDRDVGITHFNNPDDAEWLVQAIGEACHPRGFIVNEMGPAMATYAGEGGLIVSS